MIEVSGSGFGGKLFTKGDVILDRPKKGDIMLNLPFELQNDKRMRENCEPLPPKDLESYCIVNLWRLMITFDAGKIFETVQDMWSHAHRIPPNLPNFHIPDCDQIMMKADFLCSELSKAELAASLGEAKKLQQFWNTAGAPVQIQMGQQGIQECRKLSVFDVLQYQDITQKLMSIVVGELSSRTVMIMPFTKIGYYDGTKVTFSEKAREKFPLIQREMDQAGKCFAFRRHAACVFHLMRVMEHIVQCLADQFRVDLRRRDLREKTWGNLLNEMRNKVNGMKEGTVKQIEKKESFRHICALFDDVCRATRNPLLHAKIMNIESYDEEEARNAIDRVMWFINDLALLSRLTVIDFTNPDLFKKRIR
ncbi:MAG: hypothetical protein HY912_06110 [Desulfomonile tiedjei]|uniref:Uncharacterized protein n=1 Tax=Desulfomonile tiedjei TaxID=2358 RepID=A0A9D6UZ31_9BACT|nr:hypothetical protein [Desulfomonile tiedjei]